VQENKRQESKRHREFVNPVRHNSPTSGATKSGRKSTSVVLILSLSANSSFTTLDLGHTRIDFNLRTPRSEISSHYPTVNHNPCDYQT